MMMMLMMNLLRLMMMIIVVMMTNTSCAYKQNVKEKKFLNSIDINILPCVRTIKLNIKK